MAILNIASLQVQTAIYLSFMVFIVIRSLDVVIVAGAVVGIAVVDQYVGALVEQFSIII